MEYVANIRKPKTKTFKWSYLTTAAGIAFCAAFTIYGIRTNLFTSQEALEAFLAPFGIWGPLLFIGIQVVQVVIPIIPGGVSCLGGVLLFGPVWGFFYNYIGICIGSICAFLISRRFGMEAVERAAGKEKYGKYLKWMNDGTFDKLFTLAIFFPAAPDDLLCYLAGVTKMSLKKFTVIILLAKPASIALYSLGLQFVFTKLLGLIG